MSGLAQEYCKTNTILNLRRFSCNNRLIKPLARLLLRLDSLNNCLWIILAPLVTCRLFDSKTIITYRLKGRD
jgi:hypothetical protein